MLYEEIYSAISQCVFKFNRWLKHAFFLIHSLISYNLFQYISDYSWKINSSCKWHCSTKHEYRMEKWTTWKHKCVRYGHNKYSKSILSNFIILILCVETEQFVRIFICKLKKSVRVNTKKRWQDHPLLRKNT